MPVIKTELFECSACGGRGKIPVFAPASLRKARKVSGISLRGLANKLGLSAPYLSDIERGRRNCTDRIAKEYAKL